MVLVFILKHGGFFPWIFLHFASLLQLSAILMQLLIRLIIAVDGENLPARAPPAEHVEKEARCRVAAQQLRAWEDGRHDGRPTRRRRRRGFGGGQHS